MQKLVIAIGLASLFAVTVSHAASAEDRYGKFCVACHGTGAMGAPKKGDKAAWAPRLKQGEATLLAHIHNGYKSMPAKGLCNDCTDAEYKALIKYMSN